MTQLEETARKTLEALVDVHGVPDVVRLLAEVCREKQTHIAEAWQDHALARTWAVTAGALERVAQRIRK